MFKRQYLIKWEVEKLKKKLGSKKFIKKIKNN